MTKRKHQNEDERKERQKLARQKYRAKNLDKIRARELAYTQKYYLNNTEAKKQYAKQYYSEHASRINERDKAYHTSYYENNKRVIIEKSTQRHMDDPRKKLFNAARGRARKQGIPFNIELDDIIIPETCPVLGIPLVVAVGRGTNDDSPSIDKFIPSLGYVKGNVSIISCRANRIKYNATTEEVGRLYNWMRQVNDKS